MVRNYYIKNSLYKGSRISQRKFEGLLFPILIGAPISSIAKKNDVSEYTVRMISQKLRTQLSTEPVWMNNIRKCFKERSDLLHMKLNSAPRVAGDYFSEMAANIYSEYFYSNIYTNTKNPRFTTQDNPVKYDRNAQVKLENMIENGKRIESCFHSCSIGPNLREILSEYGDVDAGAVFQYFKLRNYIENLEQRKFDWEPYACFDQFIKRPFRGFDSRISAKFKMCQYCPAASLQHLGAQNWLFLASYEKFIRKLRNDERYMGLFFMSLILPTIVGLYMVMIEQTKSYVRSNRDEDSLQYTKKWMEKFLLSMSTLETDIVNVTKSTLIVTPLSGTRPK